MDDDQAGSEVLGRLLQWAATDERIRALVLESSRANKQARVDRLSDYDVIVVVVDTIPFIEDEGWQLALGTPLVRFRDHGVECDLDMYMRLVLYEDGTKIDYALWPVALLERVVATQVLPEALDTGYRVLVDKDGMAGKLKRPTYTAYIPNPPREAEYQALVEEFWWETTYVAKNLWRDELVHARYNFDSVMKFELLRKLLEWRIELDHGWSLRPGAYGRELKRRLNESMWQEFAGTYVGPDLDENWEALFRTTALFRRVAVEVGAALGYTYPQQLDDRVTGYLRSIRNLEAGGST
jgi:aminoglycoside 6-adenylyltransferase